jgi:hypothetical protein
MDSPPQQTDRSAFDHRTTHSPRIKHYKITKTKSSKQSRPTICPRSSSMAVSIHPIQPRQASQTTQNSISIGKGTGVGDLSEVNAWTSYNRTSRDYKFNQTPQKQPSGESLIDRLFDVALLTPNERIYLSSLVNDESYSSKSESDLDSSENVNLETLDELPAHVLVDSRIKSCAAPTFLEDGILIPAELEICEYEALSQCWDGDNFVVER